MLKNVSKYFGDKLIFEDVSFDFESKAALVGLNGVGKTTLMRVLLGLENCSSGEVKVIEDASVVFSENILPEFITIFELCKSTGLDLVKLDNYLELFDVNKYKNVLIKDLSLGTCKKMNIIFGLLINKKYLILDEPTNGLDYQSIYNLGKILSEDKRKVLLISHDFNFINKVCDTISILYKSKLIDNCSIDDLLLKYDKSSIEDVFNHLVESDVR